MFKKTMEEAPFFRSSVAGHFLAFINLFFFMYPCLVLQFFFRKFDKSFVNRSITTFMIATIKSILADVKWEIWLAEIRSY